MHFTTLQIATISSNLSSCNIERIVFKTDYINVLLKLKRLILAFPKSSPVRG